MHPLCLLLPLQTDSQDGPNCWGLIASLFPPWMIHNLEKREGDPTASVTSCQGGPGSSHLQLGTESPDPGQGKQSETAHGVQIALTSLTNEENE